MTADSQVSKQKLVSDLKVLIGDTEELLKLEVGNGAAQPPQATVSGKQAPEVKPATVSNGTNSRKGP